MTEYTQTLKSGKKAVKSLRQINEERLAAKQPETAPSPAPTPPPIESEPMPDTLTEPPSQVDLGGYTDMPAVIETPGKAPTADAPPSEKQGQYVPLGQYNTGRAPYDPEAATRRPDDALMPEAPATMAPGRIISVSVDAAEFEDRLGNLDYRVTVKVSGRNKTFTSTKRKQIGLHHFRGFFVSVWEDMGEEFRRAIEEAVK